MSAADRQYMRVEDAVKDFWGNRPRRPRRGRKIAGVASGIANRYRIDPVLVRVAFVVSALYGGCGVLLYLLGWLFLPEQDDEVSPIESVLGKGRSSTSAAFTVLLCIITVPSVGWFFSGAFTGEFASWVSLLIMGGLLFMLHQTRGHLTPVTPVAPGAAQDPTTPPVMPTQPVMPTPPPMPTMPVTTPLPSPGAPAYVPPPAPPAEERNTPPAWDPLGAAPFAWDLPEPSPPAEPEEPEPPAPKRRKPKVATATIGVALMAVAGLSVAGGGWINEAHVVGVALAIVGLGLVAGAFLRAGRGLIAIAVPLSLIGLAMSSVIGPGGYQGIGDINVVARSVAGVHDSYDRSVGDIDLDLSQLPATGEAITTLETEVHTDIGNVTVTVPADADVTVTCETDLGDVDCLGQTQNAPEARIDDYTDLGPDGAGGLQIVLTASTDTGNVEVRRG